MSCIGRLRKKRRTRPPSVAPTTAGRTRKNAIIPYRNSISLTTLTVGALGTWTRAATTQNANPDRPRMPPRRVTSGRAGHEAHRTFVAPRVGDGEQHPKREEVDLGRQPQPDRVRLERTGTTGRRHEDERREVQHEQPEQLGAELAGPLASTAADQPHVHR